MLHALRARFLAFACCAGMTLGSASAADLLNGQWTLNPAETEGQVHLMLVRSGRPGNTFT